LGPPENDKNFERAIRKYYSLRNDQEVGPHSPGGAKLCRKRGISAGMFYR